MSGRGLASPTHKLPSPLSIMGRVGFRSRPSLSCVSLPPDPTRCGCVGARGGVQDLNAEARLFMCLCVGKYALAVGIFTLIRRTNEKSGWIDGMDDSESRSEEG